MWNVELTPLLVVDLIVGGIALAVLVAMIIRGRPRVPDEDEE